MFLRIATLLLSFPILWPISVSAQDVISVYTTLNMDDDCDWDDTDSDGFGAFCTGYEDYPVFVAEGDLRMFVTFGELPEGAEWFNGFMGFNSVNDVLEWRVENGKAYATILRWFVSTIDDEGDMFEKDVLVVSSVADLDKPLGERTSCHVAYIDPTVNENANQLARQAAHLAARTFRCGIDIPIYIGALGPQIPSGGGWHSIDYEE